MTPLSPRINLPLTQHGSRDLTSHWILEYFHYAQAALLPLAVGKAEKFGSFSKNLFLLFLSCLYLNLVREWDYGLEVDVIAVFLLIMKIG